VVRVSPDVAWGVVAGAALGLGLWSLAALTPRMSRPRLARRVAPYVADVSPAAREAIAPPPSGPLPVLGVMLEPVLSRGRALLGSTLGGGELLARRLRQAGSTQSVEAFRSRQVLWGLAGAAIGVGVVLAASRVQSVPLPIQVLAVALFTATGVVARELLVQQTAKRRLARLGEELPVVLEFLTLSLSAGEGISDALRRVARTGRGELAAELAQVVAAVGTGLPLAETLQRLAADLDLPPFTRCVEQIVGALERGTPLAEVLRAQAQDARDDAKRALLETAGKKEVGMLVPLVFLILPVTVAFAIFPGIFVLQVGF
jgi:tight adherence protein C